MTRRAWLAVAAAGLMPVGCGPEEEPFHPVSGRVVLGDKPLTNGVVIFHPDAAKGNATLHEPRGEITAAGEFVVLTGARPGAPPGWYKVTVASQIGTVNPTDPYSVPKWAVGKEYLDPASTPLAVEVKEGMPPGSVELKVTK